MGCSEVWEVGWTLYKGKFDLVYQNLSYKFDVRKIEEEEEEEEEEEF